MLFRLARSILKNADDAEDAVQEAYMAAFRNMARFRGNSSLATWLGRIVINEDYTRLRRQKHSADVLPLSGPASGPHDQQGRVSGNAAAERLAAAAI